MIRIAINGFGRIGRVFLRSAIQNKHIQIVAINDLAPIETLAHLLKYDSIHRSFNGEIAINDKTLTVNGQTIQVFAEKDPAQLPWKLLDVDIVIESTGRFTKKEDAQKHIIAGAKKLILSAPSSDNDIKTIVLGVNDHILSPTDVIVSNASCTTNNVAPMLKIIDELCGVEDAYITTIHSYTSDQNLQDGPHKDLRRARAAANSIIPTTTGAAKAVGAIFPHLEGKLGGAGIRVPVIDGSLTDLTCVVSKTSTVQAINSAFKEAANNSLKGILQYTEDPIVSVDVIGNKFSCLFDAQLSSVLGRMIKVVGWYDNETGYSNRLLDLCIKMAKN